MPRKFRYHHVAEVESYGLKRKKSGAAGFAYIEELLDDGNVHLPDFWLRRRIGRKRVLELSKGGGEKLVSEVLGILKGFHPLVEFVNQ